MIPERLELLTRNHIRRHTWRYSVGYTVIAGLVCLVLITAPTWGEWVDSISTPTVATKPVALSKVFRCPDKKPDLSDTIVVYIYEDTDGAVRAWECIRVQERGRKL